VPKRHATHARSNCPVACLLDVLGDKWTLLVVRDLLLGKSRYGEFLESPEAIPTNLLADRLKRLEEEGIVEKREYQQHPPRYEYVLTSKGRDLGPVVIECVRWGEKHIAGTRAAKAFPRNRL
jgi:DNA-binding HxlR family transcriptional regulator